MKNQLYAGDERQVHYYTLAKVNHLFLETKDTLADTLLQVNKELRHKGIYITYIDNLGDDITKKYFGDSIDDNDWTDSTNWTIIYNYNAIELEAQAIQGEEAKAKIVNTGINKFKINLTLPKGDTGEKGKDGKNGINGKDGIDGKNGKDGINGIDGVKGDKGDKGDTGDIPEKTEFRFAKSSTTVPVLIKTTRNPEGWTIEQPIVQQNERLYVISAIINSDNTLKSYWSDPIQMKGIDGAPGRDGENGANGADGQQGAAGLNGPILYPAGIWDKNTIYKRTNDICPYVFYNGNFYFPILIGETTANGSDTITPATDNEHWQIITTFQAIFAKLAIIDNGLIGNAVFNGDFMFSQQGLNKENELTYNYSNFNPENIYTATSEFRPNVCINFKTGEIYGCAGAVRILSDGTFEIRSNSYTAVNAAYQRLKFDNGELIIENVIGQGTSNPVANAKVYIKNDKISVSSNIGGVTIQSDGRIGIENCPNEEQATVGQLYKDENNFIKIK